jgi:DNA (cytosine-5)-methyltransferase 1
MTSIKVKSATLSGHETATEGDSINLAQPNSETRRGRVGKGKAQTLETSCNQAVIQLNPSKESVGFSHINRIVCMIKMESLLA